MLVEYLNFLQILTFRPKMCKKRRKKLTWKQLVYVVKNLFDFLEEDL